MAVTGNLRSGQAQARISCAQAGYDRTDEQEDSSIERAQPMVGP